MRTFALLLSCVGVNASGGHADSSHSVTGPQRYLLDMVVVWMSGSISAGRPRQQYQS
jgi:hypothetical protein